jgi:hypothetical protein
MFNLCKTTAAMETVSLGAISCWGQSALSAATQSPWIHQGSNTWQYTLDHSRIYNHMLHRSAHILSAHRHLFWHAPWSKCNYLPLSDNHIPAKVDHLSYDATIWVLHWSFTINPPSTHSSSSHTFTALQLSYTRMSLPSIQHKLLATSCQSGTDLQLCPAHQSWPRPSLLHLMVVWKAPLAGSYGWKINEKSGIILFCCACPVNGGNY